MKKIQLEEVKDVLLSQGFDKAEVEKAVKEMEQRLDDDEPGAKVKKPKYTYYVVANTKDLEDDVKAKLKEIPFAVVRQVESAAHTEVIENISAAIRESNLVYQDKPKKQVKTIFEGLERLSAKFFKPWNIKRESKEVVMLVETDNEIIFHD